MKVSLFSRPASILGLLLLGPGIAYGQHHDAHSGPTMNYHEIGAQLATGGHFVDGGLDEVRKNGVEVVIDLRDKPPAGQRETLAESGIEWINVPVVWKDPRPEDFERFVGVDFAIRVVRAKEFGGEPARHAVGAEIAVLIAQV